MDEAETGEGNSPSSDPEQQQDDDDDDGVDEETYALLVVPKLVDQLSDNTPSVQLEAALGLTNITAGSSMSTGIVIALGALKPLVGLLSSSNPQIVEQSLQALGNMAGDRSVYRNAVLGYGIEGYGIMPPLLQLLMNDAVDLSIKRTGVWVLSNLCRGDPPPENELVAPCLPVLAKLIHSQDVTVLVDTCWTIFFYCDGDDDKIQQVIDAGLCERLVELLQHPERKVITPALRSIGYIVSGNEAQTQTMLNLSILPILKTFLCSSDNDLIHASCWVLSNIAAGNEEQIQAVIDCNIFPLLLSIISNSSTPTKTLKEATWAMLNTTCHATQQQVSYLVDIGSIKPLCDLLAVKDPRVIMLTLQGLESILKIGEKQNAAENPYAMLMKKADVLDKFKLLLSHEIEDISTTACHIMNTYFTLAELDESSNPQQPGEQ